MSDIVIATTADLVQPAPAPAPVQPVDTRSWWQKHHIWQSILGGVTVVAGAGSLVPQVAAVSPHAGAVLAVASGLAALLAGLGVVGVSTAQPKLPDLPPATTPEVPTP